MTWILFTLNAHGVGDTEMVHLLELPAGFTLFSFLFFIPTQVVWIENRSHDLNSLHDKRTRRSQHRVLVHLLELPAGFTNVFLLLNSLEFGIPEMLTPNFHQILSRIFGQILGHIFGKNLGKNLGKKFGTFRTHNKTATTTPVYTVLCITDRFYFTTQTTVTYRYHDKLYNISMFRMISQHNITTHKKLGRILGQILGHILGK